MTFIHVPSVLMITPFRQILKGVIPNLRGFDRKIFGHIFVHFAKIAKSPIGTAEPEFHARKNLSMQIVKN